MKKTNLTTAALILACGLSMTGCSGSGTDATTAAETTAAQTTVQETTTAETEETTTLEASEEETTQAETEKASEGGAELRIGQVEGAAHGDKCFTVATAVIDENDTIVAAFIDEYQFLDSEQMGVPNSDAFIEDGSVAEGKVLGSKRVNNEYYSENMEKAGSTVPIAVNFDQIQQFAMGKTSGELKELAGKTPEEVMDAVSGATLADTAGYLSVIADAADAAKENPGVSYEGDVTGLALNVAEAAAHGTKCFTITAALTDGTNVVLSYIDEFQFLDSEQMGVPNSASFTEGGSVLDGKVLGSKRVNNEYYSENMKKAGSTVEIAANFDAIQEFVNGKTIDELKELTGKTAEEVVDAVSGATLADTLGYITAIVATAELSY